MSGSLFFLHLAGAVALLLWATRMVKTGVERAYGDVLRLKLRGAMRRPLLAMLTGAGLAVALQSSTAVTLLVGSFAASGIVSALSGQIAVRGAEVGSALVVRLLSFDLSLLVPICLATGTVIFMTTRERAWRQLGRILVGIALLLLSLEMIGEASEPLRESRILPLLIDYLASDPVTAFLLAALITWLFHSSIAAVLLLATLASRGLIPPELGVVLIFGVNLGSSMIAPILTRHSPEPARVVAIGNLLARGAGSVLALTLFLAFQPPVHWLGSGVEDQMIHAHILFNVLMLMLGLPLAQPIHACSQWLVKLGGPDPVPASGDEDDNSALHDEALTVPAQALANATREVVGICDTIDLMLQRIFQLYEAAERSTIDDLARIDDRVDRRHMAVKLYLARIEPEAMEPADALRCQELLSACVRLEQVGDIITRNMLAHVRKKLERKLEFAEEGWRELAAFHASVLANARLAFNLLVSRDPSTARELVREKDRLRDREKDLASRHFARLREGSVKSMETSAIHLDTIRDLKQINSLLAEIAYPVLEEHGLLRGSRLAANS